MALQASTGLRNAMLGTGSLVDSIVNPVMLIYGGAVPANADAAEAGTLLCTISDNAGGGPLTFGTAAAGILPKDPSQVWKGVNSAGGTATHFRIVGGTDTGALSTTECRVQGLIATAGSDLNLSSVNLASGADQTIDSGGISFPTF